MQDAVRNVGSVIDWMSGTKQLLESNTPALKTLAMQKLQLANDAAWEAKRLELLDQLNTSLENARAHATNAIQAGIPPHVQPFVPAEPFGALFQSAMEEHLNDRFTSTLQAQDAGAPAPYGPPEKFDSGDAGWSVVLLARLDEALRGRHVFVHSNDLTNFRYDLPENTKLALFADWATGEPPALTIKAMIEQRAPDYTIHLGDTYYAGFGDEIRHNLISCWPGAVQYKKSFAMNGNHEMYSGGYAYFDNLAIFGHPASYFNLGNQFWRLIALDTSWSERSGDKPASSWGELVSYETDWLRAQVDHARTFAPPARIILLTHHQLFSAFDGDDLGKYLLPQVQPFLANDGIYGWFWGHEHRFIAYKNDPYGFKAWCIGNGGFPAPPCTETPSHGDQYPVQWVEQRSEPTNAWYGMRGFALLSFADSKVTVEYVDQTGATAYSETWGG